MQDIKYSKVCPKCNGTIYYKTIGSYQANKNKNVPCRKCKGIHHSEIMLGRKRCTFTDQWRKNMAISHKKSKIWKMSMNTPEYKEKHRQKMIRMIKENKSQVAFNPKACDVFDFINQKLHWNGLHAQNGKEQVVDVFFLDYYVPNLNIAIEWDEKHHHKSSHRKRDGFKSKIVMDSINCEFYRVDDMSKTIRKIDHLPIDRTNELQQVINEYYETKK